MAVALDASAADVTSNSVTTKTLNFTVGAGANRASIMALVLQGSATSPSVHWDAVGTNQAPGLITSIAVTGNVAKIWLYGLVAPTSGAKVLTATWTGTSDVTLAMISFTGVDQTGGATSFAHAAAVAGTGANSSTVTSAVGNWVVGCFTGGGSISAPSATQWWLDTAPNNFSSCGSQITGAATRTITATGPTPWAFAGVDIVAAGGATGLPNGSQDQLFPNPARSAGSISLLSWTDPLKLNLMGKDTFFSGPGVGPDYDWPNPTRAPIPAVVLRTWIDQLKQTLIGQDTFFNGPGVGPDYDWPNPVRRAAAVAPTWTDQLRLTLNFVIAPFGQDDWPVPAGPRYPSDLRTFLNATEIQLQGQDAFFGLAGNPQHDWPNPRASAPLLPTGWIDLYKFTLNGIPAPFTQGDWPNPKGALAGVALRTWLDPFKGAGTDTFFGLAGAPQTNWPNPGRTAPLLQAWTDSYKLALNGVPVPFVWQDWTNPRGRAPLLQDWTAALQVNLAGADTFFGLAGNPTSNWPVPVAASPSVALRTWTNDVYRLGLVVTLPFMWAGWVNPPGALFATGLRTWVDPLKLELAGKDQFFGLAGSPQHDWPVPPAAAPTFATSLRTWADPLKINLQSSDRFFGVGGNPQHDWPVPKGYGPSPLFKTWLAIQQQTTPVTIASIEYQYFARRRLRR